MTSLKVIRGISHCLLLYFRTICHRSSKILFLLMVLFLSISISNLTNAQEPNKRVTKVKADYLIYGTEKNFTNFMQVNSFTTYKTLLNEVTIFYDYGLSKGTKKKWEPSRNLLKN